MYGFFSRVGLVLCLLLGVSWAHHGGASISQGSGTPIETNSPITLPKGSTVVFTRMEYVPFRRFDFAEPNNTRDFQFYQLGVSHGLSDSVSATLILPYNIKSQDNNGTFQGIGDAKFLLNAGMNWDPVEGLRVNTAEDVAIDIGESDKVFLGIYGGFTAPIGRDDLDRGLGVDGGLQPGFGSPTFTLGVSAAKSLSPTFSITADTAVEVFTAKDNGDKFGNEFRANLAGVWNLHADKESTLSQVDGVLELNYLRLTRDETAQVPELGTGGGILYLGPGFRAQVGSVNLGALVKFPIVTGLNERSLQQGAEGLENYRLILTASTAF